MLFDRQEPMGLRRCRLDLEPGARDMLRLLGVASCCTCSSEQVDTSIALAFIGELLTSSALCHRHGRMVATATRYRSVLRCGEYHTPPVMRLANNRSEKNRCKPAHLLMQLLEISRLARISLVVHCLIGARLRHRCHHMPIGQVGWRSPQPQTEDRLQSAEPCCLGPT